MVRDGPLLSGRVVDELGAPIGEASVSVSRAPQPVPDIAALSDAFGRFSLDLPAPGAYVITCRAEGYEVKALEVDIGHGGRFELISLAPERLR
jgi:hypothetical protein